MCVMALQAMTDFGWDADVTAGDAVSGAATNGEVQHAGPARCRRSRGTSRSRAARATNVRAVVVGGGIFGVTAARSLNKRGLDVTLLDPAPVGTPHVDAESTDICKVIRIDYGADEDYTALGEQVARGLAPKRSRRCFTRRA